MDKYELKKLRRIERKKKKNRRLIVSSILIFIIAISSVYLYSSSKPQTVDGIEANRIAVIETNMGTIEFELFEDKAPITTKNFIDLAEKGFYNDLIFHRIVGGFIIQGGDPTGTGTGGAGYTIPDEFHPELKHDSIGILSMANSGPDTGSSQFFITLAPATHLDNKHTVFGKLIKGEDVLLAIGSVEVDENDRPLTEVTMVVKITENNEEID
jgi:peptidyl-prolyl cis-trans isomerase A (cyclophilin A)